MDQSKYCIRLVDIWHCWNGDAAATWLDVVPASSNYLIEYSLSLFKFGWVRTLLDIDGDVHPSTSPLREHLRASNATSAIGARLWFTSDQKQQLVEQNPSLTGYFSLAQ